MANYLLTSSLFTGSITIRFNAQGLLDGFDVNAELTAEQHHWLLNNMPINEDDAQRVLVCSKTAKLTKLPDAEVTFALFWDKYDDKINSSKKRAEAKWRQLSKSDQQKAYLFITRYFANIPNNTRKKYAETYLNAELWNN